jgi:8-oxo-dGTP pyrophosphatase MutT (NUDIX family)
MISIKTVSRALDLTDFDGIAAQSKMKPVPRELQRPPGQQGKPRESAVLVLLYPRGGQTYTVLTLRPQDLHAHAGQISFPGGRLEAHETPAQAALRETHEEVGIHPAQVKLLGSLTPLYIPPSDYQVHPFVGWHEQSPTFTPQAGEVAELVEVPLLMLLDASTRQEEIWNRRGLELQVPYFNVGNHKVWGATAMILSEFLERIRLVDNGAASLDQDSQSPD